MQSSQLDQKSATFYYALSESIAHLIYGTKEHLINPLLKRLVIIIPFMWLIIFYLIPFLFIFKISLALPVLSKPPITPLFEFFENEMIRISFSFSNFKFLLVDNLYILTYLTSLKIAFFSTLACLFIGYPIAYALSQIRSKHKIVFLILIIMPLWVPFLIRVYAWMMILKTSGFLNMILLSLGIISEPLHILHTDIAVYIGITYTYLPFMILPLYATLEKMDKSLIEAAADLGSHPFNTFWTIILPLSMPGVIAGSMLVFIPAAGEYVIPELLGGAGNLMVGKLIWNEFFTNQDWPISCAFAISLLFMLIIPIIIFQRNQNKEVA